VILAIVLTIGACCPALVSTFALRPSRPRGNMLSLTTIFVKRGQAGPVTPANLLQKPAERWNVAVPKHNEMRGKERSRPARRQRPDAAPDGRLEFAELNDHIGYFLRRLQVAVFGNFIRTLAPMDVRPAQYSILVLIAANPGRSQSAIGQALNIERARLARMLHEFERRKWIERRPAPDDRRSHSLFLTDGGTKALVRIRSLAERHEARMIELIGRERRLRLLDLLREFG
jgi:DNA-binding MarR family transcriptional regulator